MIRKALPLLALLGLAASAHAQFSVYGTLTLDHLTGIQSSPVLNTLSPAPCTSTVTTNCTAYKDSTNPLGFTGGISYGFKTIGPVLLSADARGVISSSHQGAQQASEGAGTRIYSGLGGLKASINTHYRVLDLSPYVQGSVGYARSNYGVLNNASVGVTPTYPGIATENNIEYHAFVGVDLRVLNFADWRVAELGYGALQATGSYSHNYPILSISTGVVFHIPPRY